VISIITWDFNFRDNLHTVNTFANCFMRSTVDFEIIVVGRFDKSRLSVSNDIDVRWIDYDLDVYHPGRLLRKGSEVAVGDVLVFCDGDILFSDMHVQFIEHVSDRDLVGLCHRLDLPRDVTKDSYTGSEDFLRELKKIDKFQTPKKINNFAPLLVVNNKRYQECIGFDESSLFATMNTKFCKDVVTQLERCSRTPAVVCPVPCIHPWHMTPKTHLSTFERVLIKIQLQAQEVVIRIGRRWLRNLIQKMLSVVIAPILYFNLQRWRSP
jgi:hypothetical protein